MTSLDKATAFEEIPFEVTAIDHVVLRVVDLERSIAFYRDVLGCHPDRRRPELGMVHMRAGSAMIDLLEINGPIGASDGGSECLKASEHFCLRVDRFNEAAIAAHLHLHQVDAELPVKNRYGAKGIGPSLYLRDPDGNRVELKGVMNRTEIAGGLRARSESC